MEVGADGVAIITIINPPVNSLSFDGTFFFFSLFPLLPDLVEFLIYFFFDIPNWFLKLNFEFLFVVFCFYQKYLLGLVMGFCVSIITY